jgi:hypothetical protein
MTAGISTTFFAVQQSDPQERDGLTKSSGISTAMVSGKRE